MTLTTVGYGDIVPKTSVGRLAGLMIMFTGIAVLGVLAGSLASFFRLDGSGDERQTEPAAVDADVAAQLAELRDRIAELTSEVSRFVAQREPPTQPDTELA